MTDDDGNSAIFLAAAHGQVEAVSALFGWGRDDWMNLINENHQNILHVAVEGGDLEVVRRIDKCIQATEEESRPLLYTGCDCDQDTPLHKVASVETEIQAGM